MTRKTNPMQGNNNTIHDRKVIFFFVLFSIGIIGFGFQYLHKGLYSPFVIEIPDFLQKQMDEELEKNKAITITELKEKDTDHDGLTDYQELYQYHTSIFLEDSDSDGYTDYEEVLSGNEPLCPKGEDCSLLTLVTPSNTLSDVIGDIVDDSDLTILQATLNGFRQFLLDNDVSQEDINSLSDDDLLTLLFAIEESGINKNIESDELSIEEIRKFLLSQPGSDKEEINNLSDDELLEIKNKLIQE